MVSSLHAKKKNLPLNAVGGAIYNSSIFRGINFYPIDCVSAVTSRIYPLLV